jgi:hypothetical protein
MRENVPRYLFLNYYSIALVEKVLVSVFNTQLLINFRLSNNDCLWLLLHYQLCNTLPEGDI